MIAVYDNTTYKLVQLLWKLRVVNTYMDARPLEFKLAFGPDDFGGQDYA